MEAYQQKFEQLNGAVRVRFAPSPTGFLHIGSARTALFNYLFAKANNGIFILRIEDTDRERSLKIYEDDILEGLKWLGLNWDEGPEIGGDYGPYYQSQRIEIYQQYLERLISEDKAYRCFCTKEELTALKQEMQSRGEIYKYNGKCRNLTNQEIESNLKENKPFIVRLKTPSIKVTFNDLIRGKITSDLSLLGDFTISRGFNEPLYNFTAAIDDYEMKITQVIRGEDHIPNTSKQIIIQQLLGFDSPLYAHIPLILGPDRSKLSKRHGATSLKNYKEDGYLSEALVNFLALLGWHSSSDREIYSLEELCREFSLDRVQKSGAIFNINKLDWFNHYYLGKKDLNDLLPQALEFYFKENILKPKEEEWLFESASGEVFDKNYLFKVLSLLIERIKKLSQLVELSDFFFKEPQYNSDLLIWRDVTKEKIKENLEKMLEKINEIKEEDFTKENLEKAIMVLYQDDRGEFLWPLRACLTGKESSPGPFEIAEILGKEKTIKRINYAINLLEK
ncbi:MAG TPA: glutamate--tRNA ligase [Candidatus Paceibacterota bacterium]|nr:glutamate--tRNA ligase [Candidatus Paceibacterota bacterium]HRS47733.1 glutamate--tRNA ligase [Candidatus Paceibacterota bacterium]